MAKSPAQIAELQLIENVIHTAAGGVSAAAASSDDGISNISSGSVNSSRDGYEQHISDTYCDRVCV